METLLVHLIHNKSIIIYSGLFPSQEIEKKCIFNTKCNCFVVIQSFCCWQNRSANGLIQWQYLAKNLCRLREVLKAYNGTPHSEVYKLEIMYLNFVSQ